MSMPKNQQRSTGKICAVCNKPANGAPHSHGVGIPKTVVDMGPVATPRPIVGTPPGRGG